MNRHHERVALALAVEFRTAGAFLVAYSTNLSKGGIFVETETPLPVGTEIAMRIGVPGGPPLEVQGVVAWVQAWSTEDKPKGMGIRFAELDAAFGDAIDRIVESFRGLRVLVMAHDSAARGSLGRSVRTVLATAEVVEADSGETAEKLLGQRECDLALIELDMGLEEVLGDDAASSSPGGSPEGLLTLRLCKARPKPTPVIALAGSDDRRAYARELGADAVLPISAPFADLQAAIVRLLSRPMSVRQD